MFPRAQTTRLPARFRVRRLAAALPESAVPQPNHAPSGHSSNPKPWGRHCCLRNGARPSMNCAREISAPSRGVDTLVCATAPSPRCSRERKPPRLPARFRVRRLAAALPESAVSQINHAPSGHSSNPKPWGRHCCLRNGARPSMNCAREISAPSRAANALVCVQSRIQIPPPTDRNPHPPPATPGLHHRLTSINARVRNPLTTKPHRATR
jgi:hypothetical protein